jgi:hypothetical protein
VEPGSRFDRFCLTEEGKRLREQAEQDTNEYFYAPWSVLTQEELHELHELLTTLYNGLKTYEKSM